MQLVRTLSTYIFQGSRLRQCQGWGIYRKRMFTLEIGVEHMFRNIIVSLKVFEDQKSACDRVYKVTMWQELRVLFGQ